MANYNVTFVKLGSVTVNETAVGGRMKTLVDDVIQSNPGLLRRFAELTSITWATSCPSAYQAWDLLIYVVASPIDSVVTSLVPNSTAEGGGLTTWRVRTSGGRVTVDETGSEIYTSPAAGDSVLLGNLAFHEALHNKTHQDSAALHRHGGLAGETVTATTVMTTAVRSLMAGALGQNRPQWLGGCTYYNDPLRGI